MPRQEAMRKGQEIVQIGRFTPRWHEAFFEHVQRAFAGADFRGWAAAGGWTNRYDVLALVEGGRILSSVGRTQMVLSVSGGSRSGGLRALRQGVQLGAIATAAGMERRGYGRRLLERVLEEADRAQFPVFLFSSPDAASYYPRFGFKQRACERFLAPLPASGPRSGDWTKLDPRKDEDRLALSAAVLSSASHRGAFAARADPSILLWHLLNTSASAYSMRGGEQVIIAEETGDTLHLLDWLGERPRDFRPQVSALASGSVRQVLFGFVPPPGWIDPGFLRVPDPTARLFVRGITIPKEEPLCFPDLLRT